ncbi:MAG: hypothetical protein JXB29_01480 [Sedimentisphaerales bacterium]|nr:hypothetical protein [Sedimentisphaerales bacterium]
MAENNINWKLRDNSYGLYPQLTDGVFEEVQRRSYLTDKLRRLSVEAEGLKASLPNVLQRS